MKIPRAARRFAFVGGIGFAIEAVLLTTITQLAGWPAWQARIPSFLTAVLTTWALNRRITFAGCGLRHAPTEAISYVSIQSCGAVINLAVFSVCLFYFPRLDSMPIAPLALGAGCSLAFNFSVTSALLYARPRTDG